MSGENIRDWTKKEASPPPKPKMYRSKFNPKTKPSYSTFTKNIPSYNENELPAKKSKVPSRNERPVFGLKTKKDFKVANAVEVILSVPKKSVQEPVRYVNKREYGKVPKYLDKVKAEITMEKEILAEFLNDMAMEDAPEMHEDMDEHSRIELIKQLKRKWGFVNAQFQKILNTESTTAKVQKEDLESQLSDLENWIKMLERGPVTIAMDQ